MKTLECFVWARVLNIVFINDLRLSVAILTVHVWSCLDPLQALKEGSVSQFCLCKSLYILTGLLQSRILIFHYSQSGLMISALEFFAPVWYKKKLGTQLTPHTASCINEEQEHWCSTPSVFPAAAVIPVKDVVVLSHRTFFYCRRALNSLAERRSPLPREPRTKTTLSCRQQQEMCEVECCGSVD